MDEITRQMKQTARENGETVRTYVVANESYYVRVKLYIFFKNGEVAHSVEKRWRYTMFPPKTWWEFNSFNFEETMQQITYWKKMGKLQNL